MTGAPRALLGRYTSALRDYLDGAGEGARHRVYEVGREAVASGLGVLHMAALHHEALSALLPPGLPPEALARTIAAAADLFTESLAPFEMAHRAFREANAALRRLNEALEEEAGRIAHALHDEAGQLLAAVHIAIEEIGRGLAPADRARLLTVRRQLDEIGAELRRVSHELRPTILDDLGLRPALEFLAEGVSGRTGLRVVVEGDTDGRLPPAVETVLYRIVQEALRNAARHARATCVRVQLDRPAGAIRCAVRDDGVGFDAPAVLTQAGRRGLGLAGIRQRLGPLGGTLEIVSSPRRGTTLAVEIPLEG